MNERLKSLFEKYYNGTASDRETAELRQLLAGSDDERVPLELHNAAWEQLRSPDQAFVNPDQYALRKIVGADSGRTIAPVQRMHFLKTAWFRYTAAVLILMAVATYLWLPGRKTEQQIVRQANQTPDVLPGGNRATLTLADGTTILLDSAANGNLAQQGGTKIIKLNNGSVAYNSAGVNGDVGYNTISTPKGGQYQIILPDNSKVWLNAASSVRFPTVFAKERMVTLTGEAYFEVSASASSPFKIALYDHSVIEVLGTGFNVNSYTDESVVKTTLLDGSVRVKVNNTPSGAALLKPGQQAQIITDNKIKVVDDADIEQVIAWKNGAFNFEDVALQEAMRQLERWYDIEVVYEKGIPPIAFWGKMGRDLNLASVLGILERAEVHFRLENNKRLVVLP